MASGFGVNGGVGRCYPFWVEFNKCIGEAVFPRECQESREDYFECLHHRKEANRRRQISEQVALNKEKAAEAEKAEKAAAEELKKPA